MYYDDCIYRRGAKVYQRDLLRESFRENGKVVKRTIANITGWPEAVKTAIREALAAGRQEPGGGTGVPLLAPALGSRPGVRVEQGKSAGAVATVLAAAEALGMRAALGDDLQGKLALYQVVARVIGQGSRLSAVRLGRGHLLAELIGLSGLDEDDLYANLDWLAGEQAAIEDRLFAAAGGAGSRPGLFLYDVTSSYFEGTANELAAFGYNRDGKKGKKQVVAGLLTDGEGTPLTIELFPGNTADPATVASQVSKLRDRFGGGELTLVGDRGMLKRPQQQALGEADMHYLTAITKPQLEGLLKRGTLQLELFEEELAEVTDPATGKRYLLRRNPDQAARLAHRRADQLATWERLLERLNGYLAEHPKATVEAAIKRLDARARRLQLSAWLTVEANGRQLRAGIDPTARAEAARLDGCYVLETDLAEAAATKETLDARYHDLAKVEWAFRTCKTAHLELRPIYLRNERRTRAHALVVMLAYRLVRHLADCWRGFDLTVEEALRELAQLCVVDIHLADGTLLRELPTPRPASAALLAAAHVHLPTLIPPPATGVDTKRKLTSRRNAR